MIENFLDSINAMLLQHPGLLHLMHTLFWMRYWILMGIMAVFLYLVYGDGKQPFGRKNLSIKRESEGVFIA